MATGRLGRVKQRIHKLLGGGQGEQSPDGQLLRGYLVQRDEAAFTALGRPSPPLVLGVCRRVLHDPQDAEDAFQAVFMVLVRRLDSLDLRQPLGNWLYGVAYRTALKARARAARRRAHERQIPDMAVEQPIEEAVWSELK